MTTTSTGKPTSGEMGLRVSDHTTAMLAYWDTNQICRFANSAYMEWFGRSKDEMVDKITMKELLGPSLYEKNLPYIKAALTGQKQVFDRVIPIQDGTWRHTLATYTPDIINGKVTGFFAHVADISYIKELEARLVHSKQEMLRNVIETQERERMNIEHILNENVTQMLVYCKMLLSHDKSKIDLDLNKNILDSINQAIGQLKELSFNLTPTGIKHFGFINGTEDYIEHLKTEHPIKFSFEYNDSNIEDLDLEDKLSIFRIIQNFILILAQEPEVEKITILLHYNFPNLALKLSHNSRNFVLPKSSREYMDIEQRLEYYGGKTTELTTADENTLHIELNVNNVVNLYNNVPAHAG